MKPTVGLCLATSLDGRIAEKANAGPSFTSRYDRHKLFRLRSEADALLIGAGTVRTEQLPPLIRNQELTDARTAGGKPTQPTAVIVSASLNLPWESAYFTQPKQPLMVMGGPASPDIQQQLKRLELPHVEIGTPPSLSKGLEVLYQRGFRTVLAEGGGGLVNALLQEDLIDHFYLTVAATFIGGIDTPLLCSGPLLSPRIKLSLQDLHREGDELHLTYHRVRQ